MLFLLRVISLAEDDLVLEVGIPDDVISFIIYISITGRTSYILIFISLAEDDLVLEVGMPTCPHALMPTYPMTSFLL